MASREVLAKVAELSDLEIALLLGLMAGEHCLIDTEPHAIDDLLAEIRLILENVFGLAYSVLNCTPDTTVDDLRRALQHAAPGGGDRDRDRRRDSRATYASSTVRTPDSQHEHERTLALRPGMPPPQPAYQPAYGLHGGAASDTASPNTSSSALVNVVIARDLDLAPREVQLAACDIIASGQAAAEVDPFMLVPLVGSAVGNDGDGNDGGAGSRGHRHARASLAASFDKHLLDHLFASYHHDPRAGLAHVEDGSGWLDDERAPAGRGGPDAGRRPSTTTTTTTPGAAVLTREDLRHLRALARAVTLTPEMSGYVYDISVFLRMSRGVAGGATPAATTHVKKYARCLAPLQGCDFVFPSLVAIAVRQVYRHRLVTGSPRNDRSLLYNSSLRAVEAAYRDITAEGVIEEVLERVTVPV